MKQRNLIILLILPLMLGAGIPNFFSGLIGKNVKKYCEMSPKEQQELLTSVNLYTGSNKVNIDCSKEVIAQAKPEEEHIRPYRIAR